jgi:hypothetical protein
MREEEAHEMGSRAGVCNREDEGGTGVKEKLQIVYRRKFDATPRPKTALATTIEEAEFCRRVEQIIDETVKKRKQSLFTRLFRRYK